jgi:hypothetical protein
MAYMQKTCTVENLWKEIVTFIESTGYWTETSSYKDHMKVYHSNGQDGCQNINFYIFDHSRRGFGTSHAAIHVGMFQSYTAGEKDELGDFSYCTSNYPTTNSNFANYNDWKTKVYISQNVDEVISNKKLELTIVVTKNYINVFWFPSFNQSTYLTGGFWVGKINTINQNDTKGISLIKYSCYTNDYINNHGLLQSFDDWTSGKTNVPAMKGILAAVNCPSRINEGMGSGDLTGYGISEDAKVNLPLFDIVVPSVVVEGSEGIRGYIDGIKVPIKNCSSRLITGDIIIDNDNKKWMYCKINRNDYYTFFTYINDNFFIELK